MEKRQKKQNRLRKIFPRLLFVMLFVLTSIVAMAQNKTISGHVTDQQGEPVIGATVVVEGTTNGTVSDIDGNFTLQNVSPDETLKISYMSYVTQLIKVGTTNNFRITMEEDRVLLDDVVVWGYGVQKKSDVTGAMASIGSKEIEARPVTNALQAMQGRMAGVDITSSERPGELGQVRIRGVRSIGASNDPLYVVDGVPLWSNAIETLNPRDIESIDVLKDASATAIYGSRGANGVIIITTKKGNKDGRFNINYSGTLTIENMHDDQKMMGASEYITWRRWAAYNAGKVSNPGDQPSLASDQTIFSRVSGGDEVAWNNILKGWESGTWDGSRVASTDWTDFVTQTGITQEHTLSVSGGSDKMQGYVSFGYLNNEGTIIGQEYERYSGKVSVDITPKKWFQMGGSINAAWTNQDYGFSSSNSSNLYNAAKGMFTYALPYDAEGNRITYPGGDTNVMTIIDEWDYMVDKRQTLRALGNFYAQLDLGEMLPILKGLKYKINVGPDFRHRRSGVYTDSQSVTLLGKGTSYASLGNTREFTWTLDNMVTYNNTFGKHDVGATLLHTATKWNKENSSISAYGIERAEYLWNAFSNSKIDVTNAANNVNISSGITNMQLESYMVRFNYGFNSRYLITASGRWDGASQLAEGHKWVFFPSTALAWRMEEEQFIKDINWINQLKLRAGVGKVGNSAVDAYGTLGQIKSIFIPFDTNTPAYTGNEPNYGGVTEMANKTLTWEKTTQYNLGVDFSVLKGRISGSIDGYISYTDDLLLPVSIPTLNGYSTTIGNIGKTKNRGVDITLNTVNVETKDFQWITNTTFGFAKDKIVELANGKQDDVANNRFIGEPIFVYYNIDNDGLWTDSETDLAEMAKFKENGYNFEPGMVKPIDQNGDYKIKAEDDRVILGNQRPLYTFGMTNTFNYKNIELSFMMFGRFKYMINTGGESQTGRFSQRSIDYWTPTNQNADYQKPIETEAGGDPYSALLGYQKANFLKMRNISLGYTLPKKLIGKWGLTNLKVYAQATNPFMVYSSIDFRDLDLNASNYNKGFVFGIDISF